MTIHVEEHPHHLESTVPHLAPLLQDAKWPSDTPTAPLSCATTDGSVNARSNGNVNGHSNVKFNMGGVAEIGPGGSEANERARPKSAAASSSSSSKGLNVVGRFSFDPKHSRRNSFRHSRGGSLKGDVFGGKLSKSAVGLYALARSPTNAKLSRDGGGGGVDGDDEHLSQDENLSSGGEMGAFEGLKWGEYVQFKMPAEEEVRPPIGSFL